MLGISKNKPAEGLEKLVSDWMNQLGDRIGTDRMLDAVSGAMAGVSATRKSVDRNVSALLSMANIPSRGEYQRMQDRLNAVQSSIRNLSRRLDDLNRQLQAEQTAKSPAKAKAKAAPKTKPKAKAKPKAGRTAAKRAATAAKSAKPKGAKASAKSAPTRAKSAKPKAKSRKSGGAKKSSSGRSSARA